MGRLEDTLYMIFQILPKSFLVTACVFGVAPIISCSQQTSLRRSAGTRSLEPPVSYEIAGSREVLQFFQFAGCKATINLYNLRTQS